MPAAVWTTTRFDLVLDRPRVMGIVNLTPDSFSDGGRHLAPERAIEQAIRLVEEGADLLDLGAESTRPGALPVDAATQWARLAPVLAPVLALGVPVSIDTRDADVMARCLEAGVDIVNDVAALTAPGALAAVAAHPRCGVCLMHMSGTPERMQALARDGDDIVARVRDFLGQRIEAARAAGIDGDRIVGDPGIGFGKTPAQNLLLLRRQAELQAAVGRPLLVGWSRKSTLGVVTGRAVDERLAASVAAALLAAQAGAAVVRVHDVAATRDALAVWLAARDGLADNAG